MRVLSHAICWGVILVLLAIGSPAVGDDIDLTALTHETQKMSQNAGGMALVWWIPEEYWAASFGQNKKLTASQVEEFLKVVRPYTIIAVLDGTLGTFGAVTYKPEEHIRTHIRIVDAQGTSYTPRTNEEIGADLKNLLLMIKPVLANMLGPLGQNMHFFVFPGKTSTGTRIAHALEKGQFKVKLEEREYRWRLPLDALLPGKICSGCSEQCKGSWTFCPWCGTKLTEK